MSETEAVAVTRPAAFWTSPGRIFLILLCGGVLGPLLVPTTGKEWSLASGVTLSHVLIVSLARARAEWSRSVAPGIRAAALGGQLRWAPLLFCVAYTAQRLLQLIP
jgi:hypothetical protein